MGVTPGSSGASWDSRPHMRTPFEAQCHHSSRGIGPSMLCPGEAWPPGTESLAGIHHSTDALVWSHSRGRSQPCLVETCSPSHVGREEIEA